MTTRLDKPVRREIPDPRYTLTDRQLIIEISRAGVTFRRKGYRHAITLPWRDAIARAEHIAGESRYQEKLRDRAMARHARGA